MSNCTWCEAKNREVFGKCYNLHGHNYKAEFSFAGFIDPETGMVANLSDLKVILQEVVGRLDHSHLNDHTDLFKGAPTTAEVISQVGGELGGCLGQGGDEGGWGGPAWGRGEGWLAPSVSASWMGWRTSCLWAGCLAGCLVAFFVWGWC